MTIVHNLYPLTPAKEFITDKTIRTTAGKEKIKTEISKPSRLRQTLPLNQIKQTMRLSEIIPALFSFDHDKLNPVRQLVKNKENAESCEARKKRNFLSCENGLSLIDLSHHSSRNMSAGFVTATLYMSEDIATRDVTAIKTNVYTKGGKAIGMWYS